MRKPKLIPARQRQLLFPIENPEAELPVEVRHRSRQLLVQLLRTVLQTERPTRREDD